MVTSLEYRLHKVGPVILGGAVIYPLAKAKDLLRFFRDFAVECPDGLNMQGGTFTFNGQPVIGIAGCYCGLIEQGEKLLKPLRTFSTPVGDLFNPMPYVQMQSIFDSFFPPGKLHYWKSNFLESLSDDATEVVLRFAAKTPSPETFVWFPGEHMHGAVTRVDPAETAFPHRRHQYNFSIFSVWSDPKDTDKNIGWTRSFWDAMQPFMAPGTYVNYLEDEGDPRARTAYGAGYDKLVALKNKYDPSNFFHQNHNIKPMSGSMA